MLNNTVLSHWLDWASSQNFLRMKPGDLVWSVVFYNNTSIGPSKMGERGGGVLDSGNLAHEQLGIVTGIILVFFLKNQMERVNGLLEDSKFNGKEMLCKVFFFLIWLCQMPLLLAAASVLWMVKKRAERKLRREHGKHFKGFLQGQDVIWSIETDQYRSVINILAQIAIEPEEYEPIRTSSKILKALRDRIKTTLMDGCQAQPKMFYQRKHGCGYYFWSDETACPIESYIRYMDLWSNDNEFLTDEKVRKYVSKITNSTLPENHSRMWEMLVSKQPIKAKNGGKYYYPVLFRVSHTLGDGVALLRLLLEALSDKESGYKRLVWTSKPGSSFTDNFKLEKFQKFLTEAKHCGKVFFNMPWLLVKLTFFYPVDKNLIHPTEICGEKVASWLHESDAGIPLLLAVKTIKRHLPGTRFTDILTTALSRSLAKYFTVKGAELPEYMSIVVPARMSHEGPILQLKNCFSVAMQKLPIQQDLGPNKISQLHAIVEKVKMDSDRRVNSPDYLVNYWIMSTMASLMPAKMFAKLLECNPATMSFSNLPGPPEIVKIDGFPIEKIGFFLPNLNTTAVGVTVLSYGNKLQLGIMADKMSIPSEEDAGLIMKQMVEEIRQMKELLTKS